MEAYFDKSGHPKIKLLVLGKRQNQPVAALLDTGFDGFLSLPITLAVTLGLELIGTIQVQYADGRVSNELVFSANIEIDGTAKKIQVTLTNSVDVLAGTQLFAKKKVTLDFSRKSIRITDA